MKPIPFCILLILLFTQCKKDKNDQPPADVAKGLMAYFQLNGNFDDSAKVIKTSYGGFLSETKNRHGYSNRAFSFNGGQFSFGTPWWSAIPITISLWVKPKDLSTNGYLIMSGTQAFGVYQQGPKLGLAINNPDDILALADITTEWTHFAGTYDGEKMKTYINGKLVNTVEAPGVPDVTNFVNIGAASVPEWQGALDDIRFYNRVLTAEEVKILYGL